MSAFDAQGKVERDVCYEPMKEALVAHFGYVSEEERYCGLPSVHH